MSYKKIEKKVKKILNRSKNSHNWDHTERVSKLCIRMGQKIRADIEILRYASLLHDIGRGRQDKCKGKQCHAEMGAKMAFKILRQFKIKNDKINKIIHCIETHRYRGNKIPKSLEAKILYDADKLDSIGAIGIGRAFLFAGEVGARLHDSRINVKKTKSYTIEDTAYREYLVKLRFIKDKLLTKEGKKTAIERNKFMVNFFNRLNKEAEGKA